MNTTATPPVKNVSDELLSHVPPTSADLVRRTWDYEVRVIYMPTLEAPESAWVAIFDLDGNVIDTIDLVAEDGIIAFNNPGKFFPTSLYDYLQERQKNVQ